jgi:secreted Zn-dependent insulinase-like peptidase
VTIPIGAMNESKDIAGISHLLEHFLFECNKRHHNILKHIGRFNAYTTHNMTMFYCKCNIQDAHLAIECITTIVSNLKINEKAFNKEKQIVLEEMISYRTKIPVNDAFNKIYANTPYSNNVIGTIDTVKGITYAKLLNYYNKHYNECFVTYSASKPHNFKKDIESRLKHSRFSLSNSSTIYEEFVHKKERNFGDYVIKVIHKKDIQKSMIRFCMKTCPHANTKARKFYDKFTFILHECIHRYLREQYGYIYASTVNNYFEKDLGTLEVSIDSYIGSKANDIFTILNVLAKTLKESETVVRNNELFKKYEKTYKLNKNKDFFSNLEEFNHATMYKEQKVNEQVNPKFTLYVYTNKDKSVKKIKKEIELNIAPKLLKILSFEI